MSGNMMPKKIKSLRALMGMTQEKFASEVGVTFATVNRWEAGKAKPSRLARMRLDQLEHRDKKSSKGK